MYLLGLLQKTPYFEVNSALISRSRVVELHALSDVAIDELIQRALESEDGLAGAFVLDENARKEIVTLAGGDGRAALTSLELASQMVDVPESADSKDLSRLLLPSKTFLRQILVADFPTIKQEICTMTLSLRLLSPCVAQTQMTALYWLARMIDAGEDPKFIARRIMILASEDIGNADPQALLIAHAAFRSAEVIGYPECRINLAQAVIYMALAPKSNAAEAGIDAALHEVRTGPRREVPSYLRDRTRPGSEEYGNYLYPHNYPGGWIEQRYLPEGLERGAFFSPSPRGWEAWRIAATERDRHEEV